MSIVIAWYSLKHCWKGKYMKEGRRFYEKDRTRKCPWFRCSSSISPWAHQEDCPIDHETWGASESTFQILENFISKDIPFSCSRMWKWPRSPIESPSIQRLKYASSWKKNVEVTVRSNMTNLNQAIQEGIDRIHAAVLKIKIENYLILRLSYQGWEKFRRSLISQYCLSPVRNTERESIVKCLPNPVSCTLRSTKLPNCEMNISLMMCGSTVTMSKWAPK